LGAEDGGGRDTLWEAGAISDYFPHREGAGNNLDLVLGVAAAAGQRKMKDYCSKKGEQKH
jgi:hypothetical protein